MYFTLPKENEMSMLHGEQVSPRQRLMQSPARERERERERESLLRPRASSPVQLAARVVCGGGVRRGWRSARGDVLCFYNTSGVP